MAHFARNNLQSKYSRSLRIASSLFSISIDFIFFGFVNFYFLITSEPKPCPFSPMFQKICFVTSNSLSKFHPNQLFWVIFTPKFFSKNLKLRVRYFFGTPYNILRTKKSKIVTVTVRSISLGMPCMYTWETIRSTCKKGCSTESSSAFAHRKLLICKMLITNRN